MEVFCFHGIYYLTLFLEFNVLYNSKKNYQAKNIYNSIVIRIQRPIFAFKTLFEPK